MSVKDALTLMIATGMFVIALINLVIALIKLVLDNKKGSILFLLIAYLTW